MMRHLQNGTGIYVILLIYVTLENQTAKITMQVHSRGATHIIYAHRKLRNILTKEVLTVVVVSGSLERGYFEFILFFSYFSIFSADIPKRNIK